MRRGSFQEPGSYYLLARTGGALRSYNGQLRGSPPEVGS